jgi:hypothetical protein
MAELEQIEPIADDRPSVPSKRALRGSAIVLIVLTGILIFTLVTSRTDCISYWSAGQLLLRHADPYSPAGALALEKAHGFSAGYMVMLNPPWALFLAAPLGFGGLRVGLFLWTVGGVACIFAAAHLLRVPAKDRAFAFVFAPAVAAVFMGQSSAFPLLGFAFFLRFHRSRPFLAGASLLLMAIKPHLFLVFWAVLLADCAYRRRFAIATGFASALALATAFAMCFDPRVFPHYFAMLRASTLQHDFFPTASMLFRMLIDVRAFWLLFVPSVSATGWGLWYYARHRNIWDWRIHGMLLMLITVLASPYSWFTDEAVLLPCILYALTLPEKRSHSAWMLLALNTVALYLVLVHQAALTSRAYIWTSATWLLWFLYSTHGSRNQLPSLSQPTVQQA